MDLANKQRSALRVMSDNQLRAIVRSGTVTKSGRRSSLDSAARMAQRILRGRGTPHR